MPRMDMEPYPIRDLRRDMMIKLTVMPRHIFKALWDPKGGFKEEYREHIVAELTRGWDDHETMRPAPILGPGSSPGPKR